MAFKRSELTNIEAELFAVYAGGPVDPQKEILFAYYGKLRAQLI